LIYDNSNNNNNNNNNNNGDRKVNPKNKIVSFTYLE
jgi:hypothetical protein